MKKVIFTLVTIGSVCLFFVACETKVQTDSANDQTTQGTSDTTIVIVKEEEKSELRRDIEEATAEIDSRIEKLNNDMKAASADAKVEIQVQLDTLNARKVRLATDLDRLDDNIESEWETFKANVRRTIDDIKNDDNQR